MDAFTWLWLIWIALFGAIEGAAIIKKSPGKQTLTEHIVGWASLRDKSSGWIARRASLVGFFGWLVYHFVSRTEF